MAKGMVLDGLPLSSIRDMLYKWEVQRWSYKKLCEYADGTYGFKVSIPTMSEWLKIRHSTISNIVYGSPEFKNKVAEEYVQVIFNLKRFTDGLVKEFEETQNQIDIKTKNRTDRVCLIATTFLQMYDRVQSTLKEGQGTPEWDMNIPAKIEQMKREGLISFKRTVAPDDKEGELLVK